MFSGGLIVHPHPIARYLASNLIEDLAEHLVQNCLNVANVCVIYDQLLKLAISESLISKVKVRMATQFSTACASDSFKQIDEDTLVAILNFRTLNITELELLKACLRWTDNEVVKRQLVADRTSKRQVFEPIKHLIRFGDLSLNDFTSISELDSYLNFEEIGMIFFHVSHKRTPIQIDYQSSRRSAKTHVVRAIKDDSISGGSSSSFEFKLSISVDKSVLLSSIATFPISRCESLSFEIYREEGNKSLDRKTLTGQASGEGWLIDLGQLAFILEPNAIYKLRFSFSIRYYDDDYDDDYSLGLSKGMTLKSDEAGVVFKAESGSGKHCIETIGFLGPFE